MLYTRRFTVYYHIFKDTMPLTHYMNWIAQQWTNYEQELHTKQYSLRGLVDTQDAFDDWLERRSHVT